MRVDASFLPQRAVVERPTKTEAGAGTWVDTFSTIAAAMPCRTGQAGSYGSLVADQVDGAPARPVWFTADTDVQTGDRLTIGALRLVIAWVEDQADGAYLKAFAVPDRGPA